MIKRNIGTVYISDDSETLFIIIGSTNSDGFPVSLICINNDSGEWMGAFPTTDKILISYD